jgi:hypothetical protein
MREVIQVIKMHDDIDLLAGREIDAAQTVTVGFNGKEWELDLTDEHADEIAEFMAPLMTAGRKITAGDAPARPGRSKGPQGPLDPKRLAYLRGLRSWARKFNVLNEAGNGWIFETNTGTKKTYYSKSCYAAYDAYLAGQGEEA